MKILYILSGTNYGGATLSFLSLLEGVTKDGNQAAVVVPKEDNSFFERLDNLGVNHYVVPLMFNSWPKLYGIKRLLGYPIVIVREQLFQMKSRKALSRLVHEIKPDLIHTNVSPLDIGHYAAHRNGIPHIWHVREYCDRDFNIHLFPSKSIYRRKLKKDYTICITKDLQKYHNLSDNFKSSVVYNGVRSSTDIHYSTEKKPYFLCASRISEEKGYDRTIRVFASFAQKHPEYKLFILGEGFDYYVERLKGMVKDLGVEGNVSFEGFKTDVDSYMKEATALLVASPSEGFGRMTAEAAIAGCLVIGCNAAGTKEILEETGGFLWNNESEYLKAMEDVVAMSEDEYSSKALSAQKIAVGLYSKEAYLSNILSFYSSIIERR